MIPSLDARLIRSMGFRPNVRRMPFYRAGLRGGSDGAGSRGGCFEGGAGRECVPVIAVELPSLTLEQRG